VNVFSHGVVPLILLLPGLLPSPVRAQNPGTRSVALTFDDLPLAVPGDDQAAGNLAEVERVNRAVLKTLAAHHATATGFVNEIKLNVDNERDARVRVLRHWLEAGDELGNHTYSHLALSQVPESVFEDDFVRGITVTSSEMKAVGKEEKYFRYPYLDTGRDKTEKEAFIAFYKKRGFRNAPVTLQNEDWLFNAAYSDGVARHDPKIQRRVLEAYLEHTNETLEYAEHLSQQYFGREIPQIMLLHDDALNADHLAKILSALEQRGYRFIGLEEALRDSAYLTLDDYIGPEGIGWLERWQIALAEPAPPAAPKPPKWVEDEYRRITGQEP
jgi:peptidoglycan/xylan/chitin deacetylase (PgdA/CDA1 family)